MGEKRHNGKQTESRHEKQDTTRLIASAEEEEEVEEEEEEEEEEEKEEIPRAQVAERRKSLQLRIAALCTRTFL